MIGPQLDFAKLDMLEAVLERECADRGVSHLGQTARQLEQSILHAFALGMQDRGQLQVFIRNLVQNQLDFAEIMGAGAGLIRPGRLTTRQRLSLV